MSNWESTKQSAFVMRGQKAIIKFKALKELDIKEMKPSCGCSKPNYNKKTKELVVSFQAPEKAPSQIAEGGIWKRSFSVAVIYKNGTREILKFTVDIKL